MEPGEFWELITETVINGFRVADREHLLPPDFEIDKGAVTRLLIIHAFGLFVYDPSEVAKSEERQFVAAVFTIGGRIISLNGLPPRDQLESLVRSECSAKKLSEKTTELVLSIFTRLYTNPDIPIKPLPIIDFSISHRTDTTYATVWDRDKYPDGKIVSKVHVEKLRSQKSPYAIFVVDRGERENDGNIGEVYLNGFPASPAAVLESNRDLSESQQRRSSRPRTATREVTSLEYRILVHVLKKRGIPGTIADIVESCWCNPELTARVQQCWHDLSIGRITTDEFMEKTSTVRKSIGNLSSLLFENIGVHLRSLKTTNYRLTPVVPTYCLLELLPRIKDIVR